MKHVYSFSGGKDSTAMVLMALERGLPVDEVVFFDTGWEFPQMYDHIALFEKNTGLTVRRLTHEPSLDDLMLNVKISRGVHEGMKGYGFPWSMGRYCTARKTKVLRKFQQSLGDYIGYVGIASDEEYRFERNLKNGVKMPLVDWGVTEAEALKYCEDRGYKWGGAI